MIYFLLLNHRLLKTISCLPLIPLALIPILKVLLFGKVGLKKKSIFKQTNLLSLLAEENKGTNWKIIASSFKNKTAIECSNHYKQNLAVRRHWSAWTPEEDKILTEWVSLNGPTKWEACSRQLTSRSGKQCRNRWINSISLIEKKPEWSPEDEYKLFFLFDKMGGCWSRITNFFNGYSQNSIKNRFYNKIRKNTQDKQISESNSSSLNFSRKAVFHDDNLLLESRVNFLKWAEEHGKGESYVSTFENEIFAKISCISEIIDKKSRSYNQITSGVLEETHKKTQTKTLNDLRKLSFLFSDEERSKASNDVKDFFDNSLVSSSEVLNQQEVFQEAIIEETNYVLKQLEVLESIVIDTKQMIKNMEEEACYIENNFNKRELYVIEPELPFYDEDDE